MENVLEKILTGNLGFGSVLLIVGILIGVYYTIIGPRLESLEKENKDLKDQIQKDAEKNRDKDEQIANSIQAIADQQTSIKDLSETIEKQLTIVETLGKLETLEVLVNKLNDSIKDAMSELKSSMLDSIKNIDKTVTQEVVKVDNLKDLLNKLTDESVSKQKELQDITQKLDAIVEECKHLSSVNYTDKSQWMETFSRLVTDINDLKNLLANKANSTVSITGNSLYQDLK